MKEHRAKVWYASYGSNILESRFHCYIVGGKPKGAATTYRGCDNKTLPLDKRPVSINRKMYFAKKAKTWNYGGVAFIKNETDPQVNTFGRMYLISADQFVDVVKQEIGHEGKLHIDLESVEKTGELVVKENSWYGKVIFLGTEDGHPVFTFTSEADLTGEINPPNENYLRTIVSGLRETYNLTGSEMKKYFKDLEGIKGLEFENKLEEYIT